VRYEDDFGSFWMVDDREFVKRRHLSRGRPRKYEPPLSPHSNSSIASNKLDDNFACLTQHNNVSVQNSEKYLVPNLNKENVANMNFDQGVGDVGSFNVCKRGKESKKNIDILEPLSKKKKYSGLLEQLDSLATKKTKLFDNGANSGKPIETKECFEPPE